MKFFLLETGRGFGIIEVLISGSIIVTMLGALLGVGTLSLNANQTMLERAQAAFLAQEGIEILRQIRDTNWLDANANTKWDSFNLAAAQTITEQLETAAPVEGKLIFNTAFTPPRYSFSTDLVAGDEVVILNNVNYTRRVSFNKAGNLLPGLDSQSLTQTAMDESIKNSNAVKATVTVSWRLGSVDKNIRMNEILTNWRPNF